MIVPPIPPNEESRLNALRSTKLLDGPPEERFDRLTRLARKIFDVPIALVTLVDSNRQWFKSCMGLDVQETSRDVSFCGHAILGKEIFLIPDATKDERFFDNPLVTGDPGIRFYAGRPLQDSNGFCLGTLCIIDHRPRQLALDELEIFEDLARMAESEMTGLQLSVTDELTQITNRRGFFKLADYGLLLCRRQNIPAVLIFFDLDGLKAVNDSLGHAAGDRLIKQFADLLSVAFRQSDLIARLGGDEFVALLANTNLANAQTAVQVLESAAGQEEEDEDHPWKLKFSSGIVEYDPSEDPDINALLEEADSLMYEMKAKKKNRQ